MLIHATPRDVRFFTVKRETNFTLLARKLAKDYEQDVREGGGIVKAKWFKSLAAKLEPRLKAGERCFNVFFDQNLPPLHTPETQEERESQARIDAIDAEYRQRMIATGVIYVGPLH